MNRNKLIFLIVAAVVIGIVVIVAMNGSNLIKSNQYVTFNLNGDFSSTGAARKYTAAITFRGNELVYATQKYEMSPTGGQRTELNCIADVDALTWSDLRTHQVCTNMPIDPPLTKKEIEDKIKVGEYKPLDQCSARSICYEIK